MKKNNHAMTADEVQRKDAERVGYVATIGMFDGVHLGHQFVLRQVVEQARQQALQSLCITFDQSPRQEKVLTPLNEKVRLIRQAGIDRVEVLAFTPALKALSAREFMDRMLRNQLGVEVLMTGYDNRFGHNREECFEDYVRYGKELGIEVLSLPPLSSPHHSNICSSHIRQLLLKGLVDDAAESLGHPYAIDGHVTHGEHIGTELGFPTANLLPDNPHQLIPAPGVYAVRCGAHKGMMNIGTRPTFGQHPQTLEVHLLNYDGDLYGQALGVEFISRLREERRFQNMEALKEQLEQDAIQAERILT